MQAKQVKCYYDTMNSPIDELLLVSDGEWLSGLYMETEQAPSWQSAGWRRDPASFKAVQEQLRAYFAIWNELERIPYGVTRSYGDIASRIGNPKASRAVGLANGRNPISIIVPCHRVIGADGSLTGYGGGIERKRWLLRHEGALPA